MKSCKFCNRPIDADKWAGVRQYCSPRCRRDCNNLSSLLKRQSELRKKFASLPKVKEPEAKEPEVAVKTNLEKFRENLKKIGWQ